MTPQHHTQLIKKKSQKLGFTYCGIAEATELTEDARKLEKWLNAHHHGTMYYMSNHFEKRIDPRILVPGAKSVVTLLFNYHQKNVSQSDYRIAQYALGHDYHFVLKNKLSQLIHELQEEIGAFTARIFTDSAPILEKAWAQRSGTGWIGKNTMLINKQSGSFFFLAEIICDLPLIPDHPLAKDYCGTCTACIDACPTNAIQENKYLAANQCISYYTIEHKGDIPIDAKDKYQNWIFGCDICQEVCPWNRFAQATTEPLLQSKNEISAMNNTDWEEITDEIFKRLFKESPVLRTKWKGLKRNIEFIKVKKQ